MKPSADDCLHLTVDVLIEIHEDVIAAFGGHSGIRDMALLESAVAAPQASAGGKSPFDDIIDIAAAYLFYLSRNHPFNDGNKRAALVACIVFLRINGISTPDDSTFWEDLARDVAAGEIDRRETTARLRRILRSR